jgi:single-strand DNA-binding protein
VTVVQPGFRDVARRNNRLTTGELEMAYPSPTNTATLVGRLTRDPELRTVSPSAGDRSVLTLRLAVRKPGKPDNDDTPTADFFDVTVWAMLAETCSRHLCKGRLVAVSARLEPTSWESQDGSKRRGMEIVASVVEFLDRPRRDTNSPDTQTQEISIAA